MIDKFSHGIVVVTDLAATVAAYERLGFTVETGGDYSGNQGGRNAYIRLGRGFLEILTSTDTKASAAISEVGRVFAEIVESGEGGLIAYGLGTSDLEATRAQFDRTALPHFRIRQTKQRANGESYGWHVYILHEHPWRTPWPVVSQYDAPEEARMAALKPAHSNGATRFVAATVNVPSLSLGRFHYGVQLGLSPDPADDSVYLAGSFRIVLREVRSGPRGIQDLTIGVTDLEETRAFFRRAGVAVPASGDIRPPASLLGNAPFVFTQL